jgi:hypothetical protein
MFVALSVSGLGLTIAAASKDIVRAIDRHNRREP